MASFLRSMLALTLLLMALGPARADEPETLPERPNIVLIMFEDLSSRIGAFGDPVAHTPILDAFAQDAVRFPNAFTTAGICAPSRSSLITGVHQQTLGTMHMRTRGPMGLSGGGPIEYDAVPPAEVKAFPELLRAAGYYTLNNWKTDYQFGDPFTVWDVNQRDMHWQDVPRDRPFFAMINIYETHESFLWPMDREPQNPMQAAVRQRNQQMLVNRVTRVDPADVAVPPYLPDTPVVRADIARHYNNLALAEHHVRRVLDGLATDGLLETTIVIVTTDHGDGLPRMKRSVYDSGIRVPLMVRFPNAANGGTARPALMSFVDLAPTILRWAQADVPDWIQGRDMFTAPPRDHIFAGLDRADTQPEHQRAVRDDRFKLIRNYHPELSFLRPLPFRDNLPTMQEIWRVAEADEAPPALNALLTAPRPTVELYDLVADPHEVRNVADDPAYADHRARLTSALDAFTEKAGDQALQPEATMIETMWPGNTQPITQAPIAQWDGARLSLTSTTPGASIGWRVAVATASDETPRRNPWQLYHAPLRVAHGTPIEAKAIRYGYAESPVTLTER